MIFINTITTAVVLINELILAVMIINVGISNISGMMLKRCKPLVNQAITPLSSSATAMIIKARTVMVAVFENPLMPSSGVTSPVSIRAIMMNIAILSTGNNSVTKRKMVIPRMIKTSIIARSINGVKNKV